MIDYDSFSRCHLTDIFFAIFAGAKEINPKVIIDLIFFVLVLCFFKASFYLIFTYQLFLPALLVLKAYTKTWSKKVYILMLLWIDKIFKCVIWTIRKR